MCASEHNADDQKAALWKIVRRKMVEKQLMNRGIKDARILNAFDSLPRHLFVPSEYRDYAYGDFPLPIGEDQTISQPYIVALMTALLDLSEGMKVLEIGTGSGYQAAVLAETGVEVFTIEIVELLGLRAMRLIDSLGYKSVKVKIGDGYAGWPSEAPFDRIIVTCAPEKVPPALASQLKEGGLMVIPVGESGVQQLVVLKKRRGMLSTTVITPVRFVPMVGPDGIRYLPFDFAAIL